MNWGNKLVVTFIVFASAMSFLVYKCTQQTFDLVSKDYYADEIRYQDKLDGMNNATKISPVTVAQDDASVFIKLPAEMQGLTVTGEVWFYCVTNAKLDKKIPLLINDGHMQVVEKTALGKTNYHVKISWEANDKPYYSEQKITVE